MTADGRVTMADLTPGTRIRHVEWGETGTIRVAGDATEIRWDDVFGDYDDQRRGAGVPGGRRDHRERSDAMKTAPAARSWQLPGWVTPHNLALIAGAAVAVVVIILLASAVRRLAKGAAAAAAPAPAPKSSGGRGKLLLLAGAAGAGGWFYIKSRHPAAATAATPQPSPPPSPRPTVTQTVAPHVTARGAPADPR